MERSRSRTKEDKEEKVEEVQPLEVYKAMLKQVEDIRKAALVLENGSDLEQLLSGVEMVRLHVVSVMEKLEMEVQMAADAKRFEEEGKGEDV